MTATLTGNEVETLVAPLSTDVDALLASDLDRLSSTQVSELLVRLEVQKRRLAAVDARIVAQLEQRAVAAEVGAASTAVLLTGLLRVSPGEAKARVAAAGELGPRASVTGEALEPVLPAVATALRAGEVSVEQVAVISKAMRLVPAELPDAVHQVAERFLVDAAQREHPRQLERSADLLIRRLDPDGTEPAEEETARRRGTYLRKYADGSSDLRGHCTPQLTAALDAVWDTLAAPDPHTDGVRDPRSSAQRRHDALEEGIRRLLAGGLPAAAGSPVAILLQVRWSDLFTAGADAGAGAGARVGGLDAPTWTGHGDLWSVRQLLREAVDADLIAILTSDDGAPLARGRAKRLATKAQRLVLAARDRGCCFPGSERPAAWTEAHHIVEWEHGGRTDIDNLCLLCRFHHREFARQGWQVHLAADGPPSGSPHHTRIRNEERSATPHTTTTTSPSASSPEPLIADARHVPRRRRETRRSRPGFVHTMRISVCGHRLSRRGWSPTTATGSPARRAAPARRRSQRR